MTFISLLTVQIFLPLLFVAWLWTRAQPSRANWILQVVVAGAVLGNAVMVGALDWTSVYLGALLSLLFVAALVRSLWHLPENWLPFQFGDTRQDKVFTGTQLLVGAIFVPLCVYALTGYVADEETIPLHFPLRGGVYYVSHGGSHPLINYHNASRSQRYALDITKLNAFGTRAAGIYPERFDRYAVYRDTIYSPCRGTVRKAVADRPDYSPPERDAEHPAGNHVVLECEGLRVHLAHMMRGSVAVDSGHVVAAGAPIGRVGNSGNTTEPHLHIHATRGGRGIPVTFDGRFLVRNSLIWE